MASGKKKATFYLPEDLLRATRVYAARRDKRESQVVEEALRGLLGYGDADAVWSRALPPEAPAQAGVTAPDQAGVTAPAQAAHHQAQRDPTDDASEEPGTAELEAEADDAVVEEAVAEPEPLAELLDPREAAEVAVAELHALRAEGRAHRP